MEMLSPFVRSSIHQFFWLLSETFASFFIGTNFGNIRISGNLRNNSNKQNSVVIFYRN